MTGLEPESKSLWDEESLKLCISTGKQYVDFYMN